MNRESRRNRRKLVEIWKFRPAWMRVVAGLAAVVMFVTVYSLILPAAAATGDQATEESGFFLEESAAETETKELAEAEPASGGEAAQEAESPSGPMNTNTAGMIMIPARIAIAVSKISIWFMERARFAFSGT